MTAKPLSDVDCDRVVVTLRRVGAIARDLRREYPDAFETSGPPQHTPAESAANRALASGA